MMRSDGFQKGTALLMSLIILLILSLLAVSGMQGSLMQERMSSAQREGMIALEIAESGARDAEFWLENNLVNINVFGTARGLYDRTDESDDAVRPDPHDDDFWANEENVRVANEFGGIRPTYYIEYLGQGFEPEQLTDGMIGGYTHDTGAANTFAFRTVVRAVGPSGRGQRILEVYYTRQI